MKSGKVRCYCGCAENAAILGPAGAGQGQIDAQRGFTVEP